MVLVIGASALAFCDDAEKTSVCQLRDHADTYNHKLVQVTSFVSHGFEDFTLQEPSCDSKFDIWLEYGGKVASGTVYCCGPTNARSRTEEMEVEKVVVPLIEDENFHNLDKLLQGSNGYVMAHTTLLGRFFSGDQVEFPDGTRKWRGYGHLGCCSLLVIQQVLAVDSQGRSDVDYESFADSPELDKLKCGRFRDLTPILPYRELLAAQASAETSEGHWAFDEPERVALLGLAGLLKIDEKSITGMQESRRSQGKIIYLWHPRGKKSYMMVVTRPYWLSFYSHEQGRVAWVLSAAYELCG